MFTPGLEIVTSWMVYLLLVAWYFVAFQTAYYIVERVKVLKVPFQVTALSIPCLSYSFTCKTGHVSQNLKALLNRLASHCFNGWEQEMNNEINIDDQYFHWISTWKDIGTKPAASAKENKIKGWKTQQVHNRHRKFYFLIDEKLFCQPPFIYNTLKS